MWGKHFRYVASVVLITLLVTLAVAVLTLAYVLVRPEPIIIAFSNFLFLAAMVVLTIGAFFEFFMRDRSHQIGMSLLTPVDYLFKSAALKEEEKDRAKRSESETSGGWMLIYAGALAVAISFLSAFIGMK